MNHTLTGCLYNVKAIGHRSLSNPNTNTCTLTPRCAGTQHAQRLADAAMKTNWKMNSFEDGNKAMLVLKSCINPVANFKINFIGQQTDTCMMPNLPSKILVLYIL